MSDTEDEFWSNIDTVINAPSSPGMSSHTPAPGRRGQKRTATQAGLASDDDEQSASPSTSLVPSSAPRPPNQNLLAVARRVGTQKKLRPELARELEDFSLDSLSTQNIKIYGAMISIQSKLEKMVASAPPFQVTKDSELYSNLVSYSNAVFFSSKLAAYKGPVALNHVLDIVKRMRFGIPAGLEHNTANWHKVTTSVQGILTQIRSTVKKEVKKSLFGDDPEKHWTIYVLTERVLQGTGCKVTVPIMARVALMRNIFLKHPDSDFWDAIDKRLISVRKKANTAEKITRAFKAILDKDRNDHGDDSDEPDVDEFLADEIQQGVDDGIERSTRRAAAAEKVQEADKENAASQVPVAGPSTVLSRPASPIEEGA
ncbi:hypothetical protein VTO73DRAFT_10315 [Trametes versicolor]